MGGDNAHSGRASTSEPELVAPVALAERSGRLNRNAVGWSRRPLHDCTLHRRWPRKKRWNYWCVTSKTHLFSATLSTLDYAGIAFVYVLEFETKRFVERTWTIPLGRGMVMSDTVAGECDYEGQGIRLRFQQSLESVSLDVHCGDFEDGPLDARIDVAIPPGHESLNVVIPWDDRHYQFTSKQHVMPARGTVEFAGTTVEFDPADANACLDFGRGVWPYRCVWNWGGGSGLSENSRRVGLNLGGKWTDGTGMTENGVIVDGVLRKIGAALDWDYDTANFMAPWGIRSRDSDEIDLTFTPFFDRVAASNVLVIQSSVHQLIGHYSGSVRAADGSLVKLDGLVGWAEEHVARW